MGAGSAKGVASRKPLLLLAASIGVLIACSFLAGSTELLRQVRQLRAESHPPLSPPLSPYVALCMSVKGADAQQGR